MSFDTIIEGGLVIDGTGNPGYGAAVGVKDGKVTVLRGTQYPAEGAEIIDASGLVVTPGFIDLHSHAGLEILAAPVHEAKIRQGVTTEVVGVDGLSYAPIADRRRLAELVRFNAGLDGHPDLAYDWDSVTEYLERFDHAVATNVALLVGNSALRLSVIGWDDRPAGASELSSMRALLAEALQQGAFGMSSGLDYPPGAYASTEELVDLSREVAAFGGIYHTHVRYQLGDRFLDPLREAVTIGRESGARLHITHLYRRAIAPGGSCQLLDLVDEAVADGVETTFDTYPYEWSSTKLLMLIPMPLQSGGPDALLERLDDTQARKAVESGINQRAQGYGGDHVWGRIHLGYFSHPDNQGYEGLTIAQVAALREQQPAQAVCDLLISEDLRVNQVSAGPDGLSIAAFVSHHRSMVGSDSVFLGERPSPRTYGTFPRILGQLVRDERLLDLPTAVRKMTSFPAQTLGLRDRGIIRDGFQADLVIFDPDTVKATATHELPRSFPEGIRDVFVNGTAVLQGGQTTGQLPGRAMRYL